MNITPRPPIPSLLPETAPFTPEQRAWLNGFFAGLLRLDGRRDAAVQRRRSRSCCPASRWRRLPDDDDGAPWHDPTMPLAERMKLAEGRPLPRRMMAAMAQQDCGQCGYNCKDYADAIFAKKEERLNLCVPGGKETARMLKKLYGELDSAGCRAAGRAKPAPAPPAAAPATRATIRSTRRSRRATASTSRAREKETWHIEFDLAGTGLDYAVGDALRHLSRPTIRRWSMR